MPRQDAARAAQKFARLDLADRVWAVAAIHGDSARLVRLHDRLTERLRPGDRVVYLGNYFGQAGQVAETVAELLDFRRRLLGRRGGFACDVAYLRGAQEEMWQKLLQLQFAPNPGDVLRWMIGAGLERTIVAYGGDLRQGMAATRDGPRTITRWTSALRAAMNAAPGHTPFFSSLRHAAFTADGERLFVHAGIDPSLSLDAQADAFWWGGDQLLALAQPFEGFKRVVRGYDRKQRGFVETPWVLSLDAGSGRGGPLFGACLDRSGVVVERVAG